jgi:hypothetical protein
MQKGTAQTTKSEVLPGLEPGTFSVLTRCHNQLDHSTVLSWMRKTVAIRNIMMVEIPFFLPIGMNLKRSSDWLESPLDPSLERQKG